MRDFYARYERDIAAARTALAPQPGQVGAVVLLGEQWLGVEVRASPGLFERAWPRLCAGYAAEAVGREGDAPAAVDAQGCWSACAPRRWRRRGRSDSGASTASPATAWPAPPRGPRQALPGRSGQRP